MVAYSVVQWVVWKDDKMVVKMVASKAEMKAASKAEMKAASMAATKVAMMAVLTDIG